MTKIKVKLEAFYGYGCCGYSYDSEEVIEVEVNDEVLKGAIEMQMAHEKRNEL